MNKWMWGLCCLLAFALAACSNEDDFGPQGETSVPREDGLYLSFLVSGETPSGADTRAVGPIAGDNDLNENLIKTVDVFVLKSDGSLNTGGYVHADLTDSQEAVSVYKGTDWIDNFQTGETYTAYVVANYKGSATLANVKTLDDLKAVVAEDADVLKWKGMEGYAGEDKTFLMDGKTPFTRADLGDGSEEKELTVDLRRAAVKVELTIKPSDDFKGKFTATDFRVRVANYATRSATVADGYELDSDSRGFADYPATAATYNGDLVVSRTANEQSVARFYTYVNRWDGLVEDETMLLIDVPGNYKESDESEAVVYDHNYYKVPIISADRAQVLERNAFYQISATVDMLGSSEIDEPVTLNNVQFTVADWIVENVTVGSDEQPTYLVLSDYFIDIRNADGFDDLEFYSSSPIKSIDFVSGDEAIDPANEGHLEFDYPGEGNTIPSIYFVNKDNERTEVNVTDETIGSGYWSEDNPMYKAVEITPDAGTQGNIHIKSLNPTNVTKRYITFKVTNEDDISKYVIVEQYPLEYIQPIAGYYSYRDDFLSSGDDISPVGVACHWEQSFTITSSRRPDYDVPTSNNFFQSKVLDGTTIYTYSFNDNNERMTHGWNGYDLQNEMMYFVTITTTSSEYTLARPLMEEYNFGSQWNPDIQEVTDDSEENDRFVSPTFMLASQLGAVQHANINGWNNAREHCAHYVETYKAADGRTIHLTDWRMPTTAELEIIKKYQTTTPDVMDKVLSGDYYYAANGDSFYADGGTSNRNAPSIRCIRDVKPDDEFMKQ